MRWNLWGAAVVIVAGASGPALAQMGGGTMYDPKPSAKAAKPAPSAKPAPRARYGYRSGAAGSCGQYKYWSGGSCKDARTSPPKLK